MARNRQRNSMNNPNLTRGPTSVRRRRMTFPKVDNVSEDSIVARFRLEGQRVVAVPTPVVGPFDANIRIYCAGNANGLRRPNDPGIVVSQLYGTALFKPGTAARWEPNCGSTTNGRVVYAWVDNPEKAYNLRQAFLDYFADPVPAKKEIIANLVTGVGNCRSFPVWMEQDIPMPMDTRRKRFDTDFGLDTSSTSTAVNTFDRSVQKALFYYIDGNDSEFGSILGSMWFNDVVHLSGLNATPT